MQCRQAEERVQALLDARTPLSADARLQQHLADCEPCRERAEAYRRVALAFSSRRGTVRPIRGAHGPRRWSRVPAPAALAALVAGLALWLMQGGSVPETPQLAMVAADRVVASEGQGVSASEVADIRFPAAGALGLMAASSMIDFEQIPPSTRQWVEPVSGGFRPLTRSVEAVFGAMRETVLGPEPGTRS